MVVPCISNIKHFIVVIDVVIVLAAYAAKTLTTSITTSTLVPDM